ncbi:molybdopterin cofactor-binding domain-containing protein, partial [Methylobacterium radiotolerans]|uniref:molybdopterin cofactor-binding domain-containing protein n=1 Tax=Methylobacterium radiotolerans TaxID=31998 RepID=UPI001FD9889D
ARGQGGGGVCDGGWGAGGRGGGACEPGRSGARWDVLQAAGVDKVEAVEEAGPDKDFNQKYEAYTHSAIFAEVKVDEELGQVRVTRIVSAIAAGKVLNPKTARSHILGPKRAA